MSMAYIREYYGLNVKRGDRVRYLYPPRGLLHGTVTGSRGALLRIRLDGEKRSRIFHPTWNIVYTMKGQHDE